MDIFEILDNKFNLCNQVDGLNDMLFRDRPLRWGANYTFAHAFEEKLLRSWKYSMGRLTFEELFSDLDLYNHSDKRKIVKKPENEQQAYLCLQLDINMLFYAEENVGVFQDYYWNADKFFTETLRKYLYIVDKAGLQLVEHTQNKYMMLVPRDEKVKSVAENTDKDTAILLYEYTSPLLKGNYKKKREILKLLANKIEPMSKVYRAKYQSGLGFDIFKDLDLILNNFEIRHPNMDSKIEKNYNEPLTKYTPKEWEEIYDTAYQMILEAFLVDNYNTIYSKIVQKHKDKIGLNK
ncbi:MAG: hypothetical protein IJF44_02985 [Clostridia bacterium]|nr:hypothetical protein [Clostridia bacterium]